MSLKLTIEKFIAFDNLKVLNQNLYSTTAKCRGVGRECYICIGATPSYYTIFAYSI